MNDFDFQEREDAGFLVINYPARKLMVYPNTCGHVVLVCEEDGQRVCVLIDPDEASRVCAAILKASVKAKPIADSITAEYETHAAIGAAMGGAA